MGMEFDEGVETINCLLERFYADWDSTDEEKKKGPFVINFTSRRTSARDGAS